MTDTLKCDRCGQLPPPDGKHVCLTVLDQAKKVLGIPTDSPISDRQFLEQRPKQLKTKGESVWKAASELLAQDSPPIALAVADEVENEVDESKDEPIIKYTRRARRRRGSNAPGRIVKSPRSRGSSNREPKFQRYQFRLFPNSIKDSRVNMGMNPHVWEAMRNSARQDVMQSMPNGLSIGVLSTSFDYTNVPREPTPETAWVFNERRFRDFIVRKISDEAVAEYQRDPGSIKIIRLFEDALKAFFNLYNFFLVGQSDAGFMEWFKGFLKLEIPRGLWATEDGRKTHRCRIMKEGLKLYGLPPEGNPLQDQEHTDRVWRIFKKVLRMVG